MDGDRRYLLLSWKAFFMSAAPMLDYAARFPDEYNSRINQVGIIQNGFLEAEPQRRGTSTLNVLIDQLTRAALSFNLFPDTTTSFAPGGPLMNGLWAFFFLLGLIYVTLRLLVVRRRNAPGAGQWSVPGGRVEPGEDDGTAVRREVLEETGLDVAVGVLLGTVQRDGPGGVVYDIVTSPQRTRDAVSDASSSTAPGRQGTSRSTRATTPSSSSSTISSGVSSSPMACLM